MPIPLAGPTPNSQETPSAGARPVAKSKDRRPDWAKKDNLPQNVDLAGLDDAPIEPSELELRACKELGLSGELLDKTRIVAVQLFGHLMRRGLTHKILMARGFSGLGQTEIAKDYIRNVMADEKLTADQRMKAVETLMAVVRVEIDLSKGISEMSEKTGERAVIEEPKLNKPPRMFEQPRMQVNVSAPNGTVTVQEKKELADAPSGA